MRLSVGATFGVRLKVEWDRKPRQDKWEITIHTRVDFQVENRDMCVVANNVSEGSADYQ